MQKRKAALGRRLSAAAWRRSNLLENFCGRIYLLLRANQEASREELHALTQRLQQGSEKLPVLPPEATDRASFYEDRR